MEGCAPPMVCGTKKDKARPTESMEPLPVPLVVDTHKLLVTPPAASSTLFAAASYLLLSFA